MNARTGMIALALAATAVLAAGACTKDIKAEFARDKQLDTDMAAVTAAGVPGVAMVIRDGSNTTRLSFGVGDVAAGTPMRVDDRVRIGSVAKSYVAVVVMQLVAEHKLSLEDTVESRLPGLVPNGSKITVRQLLNHSSGIANYEEHPAYMAPYLAGDMAHDTPPQGLVQMGVELGQRFAPGTDADYSNTGYTVLGLMIEKVTGQSLTASFEQRIFGPLKLRASYVPTSPDVDGQHAHGYFVIGQPPANDGVRATQATDGVRATQATDGVRATQATDVTFFSPSIAYSGGGIVATPDDVTAFYRALFDGRLVSPEVVDMMKQTVTGSKGQVYGLGLVPRDLACGTVWGLGGNFPGYLMESYAKPGADLQVTVAYNLDPNSMDPAATAAATTLLTHAFCGA